MTKQSQPTLTSFIRGLTKVEAVDWCSLDPYLEVDEVRFVKDARRIARALDRHSVAITPLASDDPREADGYDDPYVPYGHLRGEGLLPYESDLGRLPRLNRRGEFRMARRHEFLRLRALDALAAAGFEAEEARKLLTRGELGDVDWPAKATRDEALRAQVGRAVADYEALRNAFVEGTLYIVLGAVQKYRGHGIDTPDLIQEGNLSLYQAIEGFDWRRSVRFKTYAEYWVNQAFLKLLYNQVRTVRIPVWVQKMVKKIRDLKGKAMLEEGRELSPAEIGERLGIPAEKVEDLLATQRYAVSLDAELGGDGERGRVLDLLEDESSPPVPEQVVDVRLEDRIQEVLQDLPERERLILNWRFGLDGKAPRTLMEIGKVLKVSAERVRQLQEAAIQRLKLPAATRRLRAFCA